MTRFYLAYLVLFAGLAALEVYGVWFRPADKDTISELFGYLFRANTTAGWWFLMALFGTFAAWFPAHARRLAIRNQAKSDADRPR